MLAFECLLPDHDSDIDWFEDRAVEQFAEAADESDTGREGPWA